MGLSRMRKQLIRRVVEQRAGRRVSNATARDVVKQAMAQKPKPPEVKTELTITNPETGEATKVEASGVRIQIYGSRPDQLASNVRLADPGA